MVGRFFIHAIVSFMRRGFVQTLLLILVGVILVGFVYYQRDAFTEFATEYGDEIREEVQALEDVVRNVVEKTPIAITEVVREVITDVPLRGPVAEISDEELSASGVLKWTNIHRASAGLPLLTLSAQLSAAAVLKTRDMFDQQYFAHDSPQGKSAGDLADKTGYEYILVGENLALGNYEDDQELVQAWMDSLGHRKNILHERYTEIGIAVLEGIFEGDKIWMAVQEFGLSLDACLSPNEAISSQIDENKEELEDLDEELKDSQKKLEAAKPKYGPSYNRIVKDHNSLVDVYNSLIKKTKSLVDQYNVQVQLFNTCASG